MADLPQSFDEAVQLGADVYDSLIALADDKGVPRFLSAPVSLLIADVPLIGGLIFATILALVKGVIAPTAVAMLQVLSQLRQDAAPALSEVAGAVMGEFLGFEVHADQLDQRQGFEGNVARANVIGSALHDLLTREFTPDGVVTPETGAAAARTFSGYNINFAAQNAILSLFFDMASIHQAEQIRELGVEVAQNLGLGRLHRSAMKPLIDNLIVHPYTKYMNAKYQQTGLSEQRLCQAFLAGDVDATALQQGLLHLGYPVALHDIVVHGYTPQLTVNEVYALIKAGDVPQAEAIGLLRKQGWSEDFAHNKLAAVAAEELLREEKKVITTLEGLVKERYMDTATFAVELRKLHLYDDDIELILRSTGYYLEHQYRHFTLAEVLYMVDRNIITDQDVQDWAASIGFNAQDRDTLSLFFASKENDYEQQVQAKRDAAAKKKTTAPPKPPTKPPTTTT
jgi:hypothetical protein